MGELFRSQEMQLVQLFVQIEAAHDTVDELGKLGLVQFRDLNSDVSAFQRNFVNEVKKCDEMERKLRFFEEQVEKERRDILHEGLKDKDALALLSVETDKIETKLGTMDELDTQFDELEKELQQMNNNQDMLNRNYNELIEMKYVLTEDTAFFSEAGGDIVPEELKEGETAQQSLLAPSDAPAKVVKLGFITGVILRDKFTSFERILWRSTRGNLFMKFAEISDLIKDPQTEELVEKCVFIIFYQGERSQTKIKKICESFGANTYQIPESANERKTFLGQVNSRLKDLQSVIDRTKTHRRQVLADVGRHITAWKEKVIKEKAIYDTMNLFNYDIGRKCLIAEGWTPKTATEKIVNAMRQATESSGALVPSILSVIKSKEEPPTTFKTNKFTKVFQGMIDSYGIARYQEVNPGVFTIITFPFLFAVMFGDFGHGILMTIFASYLVYNEKKLGKLNLNEMIKTCFTGRYLLLLMGIFSMYTGLLYNECFSVAMQIFGPSAWVNDTTQSNDSYVLRHPGAIYPFGVDPMWGGSPNMLTYYNSLKMKMSVIFGVTQMVLGIIMSLLNALHFHHPLDIIGEFIPQMIFMLSLFGYMCVLIIYKWCINWNNSPYSPPFIINLMIGMFLSPTDVSGNQMYSGQEYVQLILIALAFISVPWMLFLKPRVLKRMHENKMRQNPSSVVEEHDEHGEEFDSGEIMVKQVIHTIEFVLGAISNTASYLRLWALSLAHSELSQVFWQRVIVLAFGLAKGSVGLGFVAIFICWSIWAGMTAGVLMVMESLSAFLHALRLHWVEFQNKFYHGDGRAFKPFSYELLLHPEDDE